MKQFTPPFLVTEHSVIKPLIGNIFSMPLIMLAMASLGLVVLVIPPAVVGSAFPRLTLLACLIGTILTCRKTKFAIPVFLVLLAPLRTLGITIQYTLNGFPVTPVTIVLAALLVLSILERWRAAPVLRSLSVTPRWIWTGIVVAAIPALWMTPPSGYDPIVTRIIFVTGILEPIILFVIILTWLQMYRDVRMLLIAILTSCFCGLITGLVIIRTGEFAVSSDNLSMLRFNLSGFGGANTAGFVWVLLYPLMFIFHTRRIRDLSVNLLPMLVGIWGMALASYSRATPVILGLQTLLWLLWSGLRHHAMRVVVALGLILGLSIYFIPSELQQVWTDRFSGSDMIGVVMGHPGQISASDEYRLQTRSSLVKEIMARPFGGYAAIETEDPENLYLDIALQLGWGTAVGFLCMQIFLLWQTRTAALIRDSSCNAINRLLFSSLLGSLLYGATTGVNLVKISIIASGESGYQVNNMPAIFFAVIAALALFASDRRNHMSLHQMETY